MLRGPGEPQAVAGGAGHEVETGLRGRGPLDVVVFAAGYPAISSATRRTAPAVTSGSCPANPARNAPDVTA